MQAGTTDVDAVREAMIGQKVKNLTGSMAVMLPDHHLTKPVLIGEIRADGQFNVVYKTSARSRARRGRRNISTRTRARSPNWTFPWVCESCTTPTYKAYEAYESRAGVICAGPAVRPGSRPVASRSRGESLRFVAVLAALALAAADCRSCRMTLRLPGRRRRRPVGRSVARSGHLRHRSAGDTGQAAAPAKVAPHDFASGVAALNADSFDDKIARGEFPRRPQRSAGRAGAAGAGRGPALRRIGRFAGLQGWRRLQRDAVTGKPVTGVKPDDLSDVTVNNRLRGVLQGVLGQLTLLSPDPALRITAAQAIADQPTPTRRTISPRRCTRRPTPPCARR